MYTPDELIQLQDSVNEMLQPSNDIPADRQTALQQACQNIKSLYLFAPVAVDHPELFSRVREDTRIKIFGATAVLPMTADKVYDHAVDPQVCFLPDSERAILASFRHPNGEYFIKSYQSEDEREIARFASEQNFGPKHHSSISNLITEEWVHGTPLAAIHHKQLPAEKMESLGMRLGQILRKFHDQGYLYNDLLLIKQSVEDSHLFITSDIQPKIIDFGVSIRFALLKQFASDSVRNYIRGHHPGIFLNFEKGKNIVQKIRSEIKKLTPKVFVSHDLENIQMQLFPLLFIWGKAGLDAFCNGFNEGYNEPYTKKDAMTG